MSRSILAPLRGVLAAILLAANTLFWVGPLLTATLVKLALPFAAVRRRVDPVLNTIATAWIGVNNAVLWDDHRTRLDAQGHEALRASDWYMVISNHRSWVDILVLQRVLNRRVPLLKFFLKWELVFVPVIGVAWWALDFPFMRRHGKAALRKHPELREKDRDATRRACEKFALVPTSVMTFPEGTRLTSAKQATQGMPYRHLLKPKAGSLAMSLNALGTRFQSLLDVTIVYPDGTPDFWDFLCGRCPRVLVRVHARAIAPELCAGDYTVDTALRRDFHRWLDAIWREKDDEIEALLIASAPRAIPASGTAGPAPVKGAASRRG